MMAFFFGINPSWMTMMTNDERGVYIKESGTINSKYQAKRVVGGRLRLGSKLTRHVIPTTRGQRLS